MIIVYGFVMLILAYLLCCFMESYILESPFKLKKKFSKTDIMPSIFLILWIVVFSIGYYVQLMDIFTYVKYSILVIFVIVIAFIDLRTYTIPLILIYILIGLRVFLIMIEILLYNSMIMDIIQLYGYGVLFALVISFIVYYISKKGLGEGDIMLISIIGSYIGLYNIMAVYFLSSIVMLVIALFLILIKKNKMNDVFPMVPAIAISLVLNTLIIYFL